MNVQRSYRNYYLLVKKNPFRNQKKYLANISNGSFNTSLKTGVHTNKIRTLQNNNKVLALALQNDRAKNKELMEENKANANIIMFSILKLASLSDNLMKVVTVVDETLCLLQKHSSGSSSKFTPRNTIGREEFKEQIKEVFMDSIPEEAESPIKATNEADFNLSFLIKRQSDPLNKDVSPEFQMDMLTKEQELPKKPMNTKRTLRNSNLNKTSALQEIGNTCRGSLSYGKNYEFCKPAAVVNKFDECSPAKNIAAQLKKKSLSKNKNFTSEACDKVVTKSSISKKSGQINKTNVWEDEKRNSFFNKDKNNKLNNSPTKTNLWQSKVLNDIHVLDDNQISEKKSKNPNVTSTLKNSISSSKSNGKALRDIYDLSDCEKENVNSHKKKKFSAKRFKSLGEAGLESTVAKRNSTRSSALQSLSSKINSENFKSSAGKDKTPPINDLIIAEQSDELIKESKSPEISDASRSYLQDISLHQQEMIRNLAESTFIVTAEVHKNFEPFKGDKMKCSNAENFKNSASKSKTSQIDDSIATEQNVSQPVVLVTDIFTSGKSFCKSISSPACGEPNRTPLELQLLEHCSSLKVIPEESMHSQNDFYGNSSDKIARNVSRLKHIEPPLSVEGEIVEHEEKRIFRKRSSSINYKEPPVNIKLRR